ncbi:hypothetical protein [Serratia marcescens]|uniref:hypothetical protein n=1 Tax=Serratia marcescens TaxID=615 RepID=UPI000E2EEAB9|nr:hypothetical protein [Serratia marcescens]
MSRRVAFPFLTLSDSAVDVTEWTLSLNDSEWEPIGDFLRNWDSSSVIRLRRKIKVDSKIASNDLGLDEKDFQISVVISLGTGPGRLPRKVFLQEIRSLEYGVLEAEFEFEVFGRDLSTVLDVFTQIILISAASTSNILSPQRFGDRLWSDRFRVRIEGDEQRFPIEIADFSLLLKGTNSSSTPWYLHWSPYDWARDFHGAMKLYLNNEMTSFVDKILSEDPETLQVLMADVMGQVCERLVMDQEAAEIFHISEAGTLGGQASAWLKSAWPDKDIAFIKSILENRPGMFRAAFLTLAELRIV